MNKVLYKIYIVQTLAVLSLDLMAPVGGQEHFVLYLLMCLAADFRSVYSECAKQMELCPNSKCEKDCDEGRVSDGSVETIVAIMSIAVVLIIGLIILLVYVCLKQGSFFFNTNNEDTSESNAVTCERTAVEIPEYLLRRRFSSLSVASGPPPYFSLFNFICNENGHILRTVIGPQNLRTDNIRLPSVTEQPPPYGALFGQSPPPYDVVIQLEETTQRQQAGSEN